ncbi:MAG: ribbon-helix-helix domain-containing protein [Candidatus Dormibacteria bacterium]
MKTAISLPDQTFERVNRRASEMGMSRSEFFARAAERYLEQLDSASITAAIDEVLENAGDDSGRDAVAAGRHRLAADNGW